MPRELKEFRSFLPKFPKPNFDLIFKKVWDIFFPLSLTSSFPYSTRVLFSSVTRSLMYRLGQHAARCCLRLTTAQSLSKTWASPAETFVQLTQLRRGLSAASDIHPRGVWCFCSRRVAQALRLQAPFLRVCTHGWLRFSSDTTRYRTSWAQRHVPCFLFFLRC